MGGKNKQTTDVQQRVDPRSQQYIDQSRQMAAQGANQILAGPYGVPQQGGYSANPRTAQPRPQPRNALEALNQGWNPSEGSWRDFGGGGGPDAALPPGVQSIDGAPMTRTADIISGGEAGPQDNSFFSGPLDDPSVLAEKFFNPYQQQVVDATQSDFDRLRQGAGTQANQAATMSGAFRGSRHGVESAVRKNELDRMETSSLANLRNSGFQNSMNQGVKFGLVQNQLENQRRQEPIFRYQTALGLRNLGMGPTGQDINTENVEDPSVFGQLLNAGAMVAASKFG